MAMFFYKVMYPMWIKLKVYLNRRVESLENVILRIIPKEEMGRLNQSRYILLNAWAEELYGKRKCKRYDTAYSCHISIIQKTPSFPVPLLSSFCTTHAFISGIMDSGLWGSGFSALRFFSFCFSFSLATRCFACSIDNAIRIRKK